MKRAFYWLGRAFQAFALLVLPSALWAGSQGHVEAHCIFIFLAAVTVFYAGYFLTRFSMRL